MKAAVVNAPTLERSMPRGVVSEPLVLIKLVVAGLLPEFSKNLILVLGSLPASRVAN
jgi:hypothetical protein